MYLNYRGCKEFGRLSPVFDGWQQFTKLKRCITAINVKDVMDAIDIIDVLDMIDAKGVSDISWMQGLGKSA